jgi:hypothetical protein
MSGSALVACAVCFGAADGPLLTATRLGVLVMVGVTLAVLVAFAVFFLRLSGTSVFRLPSSVFQRGPR